MDGGEFVSEVRDATATELDRLGSERALVAVTEAAIERERVLETAADAEARAVATCEQWTADERVDAAREAFDAAAERERAHFERVRSLQSAGSEDDSAARDPGPDALHEHLRRIDDTVERVGAGLVARPLVASRTLLQVINFFVNEGDEAAAGLFRELRAETDEQAVDGATLLLDLAGTEEARRRGLNAASGAITVAYEEYVDRLTAMGVDPKPVC